MLTEKRWQPATRCANWRQLTCVRTNRSYRTATANCSRTRRGSLFCRDFSVQTGFAGISTTIHFSFSLTTAHWLLTQAGNQRKATAHLPSNEALPKTDINTGIEFDLPKPIETHNIGFDSRETKEYDEIVFVVRAKIIFRALRVARRLQ